MPKTTIALFLLTTLLANACASSVPATSAPPAATIPVVTLIAPTSPPATAAATAAASATPTATVVSTPIPPTAAPAPTATRVSGQLSPSVLKNATYTLTTSGKTVRLTDGQFKSSAGADSLVVSLIEPIATGDLNGDGIADAAIVLAENTGGTGNFISALAVLNVGGKPVQSGSAYIDDRAKINRVSIQAGEITVDALLHGPADPMCCPAFPVAQTLRLLKNRLVLTRQTSRTPTGLVREVRIASPASGAKIAASVQIKGTVTISPFENNLSYRIYDAVGKRLATGPVAVKSAGMGEPGTFDVKIDTSKIPAGTAVLLEILDLSAADGSILAMDSIELAR